jgi:hypothetical protein
MSANLWAALGIVCAGGAVGGAVNAFVSAQGFGLPGIERTSAGARIWKPGGLGTVLVGAFAAGANWGLYGPFTSYFVFGDPPAASAVGVTLAALVTGSLVGFAGARWLTNEVDKNLLRATAAEAAAAPADARMAARIATATPADSLRIVEEAQYPPAPAAGPLAEGPSERPNPPADA